MRERKREKGELETQEREEREQKREREQVYDIGTTKLRGMERDIEKEMRGIEIVT